MDKPEKVMNTTQEEKFLADMNQNIGIIHRVCQSYFINDKEEREDLFQEILYQLWKSYPTFQGEAKFSTWMYKVALNTAITHRKKTNKTPVKEKLTEKFNQIAENNDQVQTEEKIKLLYLAINKLTDIDKALILLYLEDNSYDEIATVTGLTKTNVSVRLVRIKRILEDRLKKQAINQL